MNEITEKLLVGIAIIILSVIILALPVKLLWNWLMPMIFELGKITFWQAAGLLLLIQCLFKTSYAKD